MWHIITTIVGSDRLAWGIALGAAVLIPLYLILFMDKFRNLLKAIGLVILTAIVTVIIGRQRDKVRDDK